MFFVEVQSIRKMSVGVSLLVGGVVLFLIGLFANDYHEFTHTSLGTLSGVSYPLYPLGVVLIVLSIVVFTYGFYLVVKENIQK